MGIVRDEEDIIRESIEVLLSQGVDTIVVVDHRSRDRTPDILQDLAVEFDVRVIHYGGEVLYQSRIITRLARAAALAGADWIIPFDADEIWKGADGRTIREVLTDASTDVVRARWYQYVPEPDKPPGRYSESWHRRQPELPRRAKVAFRANYFCHVTRGNHDVHLPDGSWDWGLRIAHYRYRDVAQVLQKGRAAAMAVRSLPGGTRKSVWRFTSNWSDADAADFFAQLRDTSGLVLDPPSRW